MKIVVFGATGSTGRLVVDQALRAGHEVTAVVRRPDQVAPRLRLVVRAGDVLDAASLHESCSGADAVMSCIGPRSKFGGQLGSGLRPGTVMSVGTAHMVAAAEAAGVRRFVFQSGIGLSDGEELSPANRWVMRAWRTLFAAAIRDKAEGERLLRASALEWVIVRPVGLSDAPAAGHYLAGPRAPVAPLVPLSLADCAACLLRALSDPAWTRQIVNLGRS
jgi:uncharacterized protein YbjT (DUF2867 family)